MAQTEDPDSPLPHQWKLRSPADKVFNFFWKECNLFPKIVPVKIQNVELIKGRWDSVGSERRWTFCDANCGSWEDIVQTINDQTKSITWSLKDGKMPNMHYKALWVDYQFSPKGEGCQADVRLHFQRTTPQSSPPSHYMDDYICDLINKVDEYLQSIEKDA